MRPFGAAVMIGSWTETDGSQLFCIEPSGVHYGYWGCSAGKARQAAKTEIEKLKTKDMTCKELLKEAAKIIYQVRSKDKKIMYYPYVFPHSLFHLCYLSFITVKLLLKYLLTKL